MESDPLFRLTKIFIQSVFNKNYYFAISLKIQCINTLLSINKINYNHGVLGFWDLEFLSHSYWLSKSGQISRKNFSKNGRCKKTTLCQYWFFWAETKIRVFSHGWDDLIFVSAHKNQYWRSVVFLWHHFSQNFFL